MASAIFFALLRARKSCCKPKMKEIVFIAQINPTLGDLTDNSRKMIEAVEQAQKAGACLIVFPQLAISGYPPQDLLKNQEFLELAHTTAEYVASKCDDILAIFGAPVVEKYGYSSYGSKPALYNAAIQVTKTVSGRCVGDYYAAINLHKHNWFDAQRYFCPGEETSNSDTLTGLLPGFDLLMSVDDELFEDNFKERLQKRESQVRKSEQEAQHTALLNAWLNGPHHNGEDSTFHSYCNPNQPKRPLLIVNLSARPFVAGQQDFHRLRLTQAATQFGCYILDVNLAGAQDQLIFEGGSSLISPCGNLLFSAPLLEEYYGAITIDTETEDTPVPSLCADCEKDEPFLTEQRYKALCLGLGDYVRKNHFSDVVLGISGGIDSALCAALAVKALGAEHVHGIYMPSCYSADISGEDASRLCQNLNIDCKIIAIEGIREAFDALLAPAFAGKKADLTEENIQARLRAIIVMAMSNKFGWLALCTGNKAEEAMGYSTLYGDGAGGLAPILDLYKGQVVEMCRYINRKREIIPERIITRPPSAELHPNQKDEDTLPPYAIIDHVLEEYLDKGRSRVQIIEGGCDKKLVDRILHLLERNEFKRRQGPIGLKVSPCLLGLDRLMPITKTVLP